MGSVVSQGILAAMRRDWRLAGDKMVFTNGCFDLLTVGHVRMLQKASLFGNVMVVAVNSDWSVKELKGTGRPIVPAQDRMEVLAGLRSVDYVVELKEKTPEAMIEKFDPDVLVKGGDWKLEQIIGAKSVLDRGGSVHVIPFELGYSTTAVVERVRGQKCRAMA